MNSVKINLIVINLIFLVLIVLSSPVIIMSPMMFDAPGSETLIPLMMIFYSLIFVIPMFIISSIGSIILYSKKKEKLAVRWSFLPLINIIIFVIGFILQFVF
jgi:hypothetical protein